jgi:hypothetical protein
MSCAKASDLLLRLELGDLACGGSLGLLLRQCELTLHLLGKQRGQLLGVLLAAHAHKLRNQRGQVRRIGRGSHRRL